MTQVSPDERFGQRGLVTLDRKARNHYVSRLAALREQLQEAECDSDIGRIQPLRNEIEFLTGELAAALGLGGRRRVVSDDAERARVAVTKRIKQAIAHAEAVIPPIGRHLRKTVRTGLFCEYLPDPDRPIRWILD